MPVLLGGHNLPPLVEIGLTDRPKTGGDTQAFFQNLSSEIQIGKLGQQLGFKSGNPQVFNREP